MKFIIKPESLFMYTIGLLIGFYTVTELSSIIIGISIMVLFGVLERLIKLFRFRDNEV